ncbi:adenylate cyclase [Sulfurimonas gotlandica GD1]|uniref:Adenylate cyclase n=1 Tax=Sulfurimonas gotlandica (strain DSM 19862 / JCM 16533 / GD1) TaxID=929558 RepID=B6BLZ5_SULGG|nr:adenylate/guanylate cyclase domain-containing protein [Sulfurimonas gotlandica]EDZ61870.1 adenylate cyclase [Sulfurimonas gotlandica GD1]EHP29431.1 adenylate cyclase [Sulfurimonas gotlandica GD1]
MKEKLLYLGVLIPILLITLLLQMYKVEPFESFSLRYNDINFDLQKKTPSKDIVFVAVDEPSVNEFGRWPWKREIIAKGIDGLLEADVVLMDMIFSEPTSQEQDSALAESLLGLNSSVCGFFLRAKSTQNISNEELEILGDSSLDLLQSQISEFKNPQFVHAPFAEMNIVPILQACSLSGSFSTLSESDHLLRSYPIAVYFQNILYPSLAMQGLRLKFNKDVKRVDESHIEINERIIGVNKKGFIRLNFYNPEQYNVVSFLDVATGKIKQEYFRGKMVILGITDVGAGDVVSTPMGSMPGPLLHYTFISNLLENHLIKEPKNITPLLIVLMVLLPFILVLLFKKILHRVVINIIVYLIVYAYIRYLFVTDMIYIDLFYPLISLVLSLVAVEAIAFNLQEQSGKFMRGAFSSYLSGDLLDKLIENPEALALGGESKELSILFSDIRGFTTISESMDPVSLITLLNRYFTPMTNAVLDNGGMLDKYIGDAVMAFFNAPVDIKDHADASCKSALEMIEKLDVLNEELALEGINPIRIGIGINTADVVVGNMGSDTRFNYTVIGDGVNLASRVEGLTKNYGVNILITEFTVAKISDKFIHREIEPVKVKGKDEAVLLHELMPDSDKSREIKKLYDEALRIYKSGDFKKAEVLFDRLVKDYDDHPSKYFLPHIKDEQPWGVHKMTTK